MYKMPEHIIEKGFLQDLIPDRDSIGIILDKSAQTQVAYDAIRSVQNFLPHKTEVCFFVQEISRLPLTPTTGLYYSTAMITYKGNLVATSISSTHDAIRSGCQGKIIFYIRDMSDLSRHPKETVEYILSNPEIIKVCASENYHKFIIQNYPSAIMHKKIVKDFDMSGLHEIIFGE